mmetsp:Transcript_21660/g.32245  ORF Transcript_21660/g.32245 Transcript_21660/m.32245 type:complete len:1962 (-) Transcript_21660:105-5990(-)
MHNPAQPASTNVNGTFAGQKRARPVHHTQSGPTTFRPATMHPQVRMHKRQKATYQQPSASASQTLALQSAKHQVPLTTEQQRVYVVEHRKISIAQLRKHLGSAEAELKHLQKGGHYVNFRVSSGPDLSMPSATAKFKKKKAKRKRDKFRKEAAERKAAASDGKKSEDSKKHKTIPTVKAPIPGPPPVPTAATAQQKTLLKELDELQKKKQHLTAVIRDFQKKGGRRMKKTIEPPRNKVHWDYLLDEMGWMSTDFNNERKWKARLAKKIMRAVVTYHERQQALPEREAKLQLVRRKKGAAAVARLVKKFWLNIGKLVDFKRNETLNKKKNVDLNRHLELLVDHTQSLTKLVAKDLVVGYPTDEEFTLRNEKNTQRDREDRKAIEQMEAEEVATKEEQAKEVKELEEDNKLSLDELKVKYSYKDNAEANGEGMEIDGENEDEDADEEDDEDEKKAMLDASAKAMAYTPSGFDLGTVKVKTKLPSLLRHGTLREYQHIGLDWLVTMCENNLNGILADEMGLGKTIQTIAMLAHLACEKKIWGQHLVVVPTVVLVNWEIEFKRWLPGFKVLCYHGSAKERKRKRKGWSNPNTFHVCITSYQIILQDSVVFKRKRWHYLILDEAQNIKNFRTKRWQVLLTFRTERRLLLTGTPLQNNVMELWSLMHFLMPHVFQSQKEFQDWFSDPVKNMVEGKERMDKRIISSLHKVLRPFILRRLKKDVAKQMPKKYEHVVYCRLAKRQRILYEEFMANSATRNTLASNNFLGLMNVLMQLRKVCNHPDIFAGRPIISPFDQITPLKYLVPSSVQFLLERGPLESLSLKSLGFQRKSIGLPSYAVKSLLSGMASRENLEELIEVSDEDSDGETFANGKLRPSNSSSIFMAHWREMNAENERRRISRIDRHAYVNRLRCTNAKGFLDANTVNAVKMEMMIHFVHLLARDPRKARHIPRALLDMIKLPRQREKQCADMLNNYVCVIPKARAPSIRFTAYNPKLTTIRRVERKMQCLKTLVSPQFNIFHRAQIRMTINFPDKRLIQWDCGKLQKLSQLLKQLKSGGHRVLLFTQMTKMLDILEHFLNIYGYTYLRLDGTTKPEQRQKLMERFNNNSKIFVFILSTRSGGVGVNLTGADTVIFYDTDWNPAMDLQAQDRCHRIGQTREVHIYRLVTKNTIEENILKKSNQKRQMNNMVIGDGEFNTQFFSKMDPRELLGMDVKNKGPNVSKEEIERAMAYAEDDTDRIAAKRLTKETKANEAEFSGDPANKKNVPLTSSSFEMALSKVQRYALRYVETYGAADGKLRSITTVASAGPNFKAQPKNGNAENIEKRLFYPSSKGVKGYRAHVAHVEQNGFIYDSKIFTPLQFPREKHFAEISIETDWGLFVSEEAMKKLLPSSRDRRHKQVTRVFLRDNNRKRRLNDMDTASMTVRVPLSLIQKRRVSRRANDSQHFQDGYFGQKENRQNPRKAYYRIKRIRRMYTDGLFPPKVVRHNTNVKSRSHKADESTSSDHIPWTQDEETLVERAYKHFGPNWKLIANILNSNQRVGGRLRSPASCFFHHNLVAVRHFKSDEELRRESQKRKKKEGTRKKKDYTKDQKNRNRSDFVMATPKQPCGNHFSLVEKSMKSINAQRRLSLENEDSTSNNKILKNAHPSHKKAITESHTRLGLPQLAIGKTLMPHQIIQLRTRCRDKQATGRIGPSVHHSNNRNSSQYSGSKQHAKSAKGQGNTQRKQQQQQQQQQAASATQQRSRQQISHDSTQATQHSAANGKPLVNVNHQTQLRANTYNPLIVQDKNRTIAGTQAINQLLAGQHGQSVASYQAAQHLQGATGQIKPTLSSHKPLTNHIQRPVTQVTTGQSAHQLQVSSILPGRTVGQTQLTPQQLGASLAQIQQQKNIISMTNTTPGGVQRGLSSHPLPNTQFLKYALHSVPSLKQEVVKILARNDCTETQKIDRIATLFRKSSAKQGKTVPVKKDG